MAVGEQHLDVIIIRSPKECCILQREMYPFTNANPNHSKNSFLGSIFGLKSDKNTTSINIEIESALIKRILCSIT